MALEIEKSFHYEAKVLDMVDTKTGRIVPNTESLSEPLVPKILLPGLEDVDVGKEVTVFVSIVPKPKPKPHTPTE